MHATGLRRLETVISVFDRVFMAVSIFALFMMLVSVCIDAGGRYLFNRPLSGSYEFVSLYAMVALTFMAMPRTYAEGGMIRVELFSPLLARHLGSWPERLNTALAAGALGLLAWYGGFEAYHKFAARETTLGTIQFPMYWSYVWFPLGAALLSFRLALETIFPGITPKPAVHNAH